MNKNVLIALLSLILLLLLGALGLLLLGPSEGDSAVACTEEAKVCPDGSSVGRMAPSCAFAPCPSPTQTQTAPLAAVQGGVQWKIVPQGENASGIPRTNVQILVDKKPHDLGTYDGSCAEIAGSSWELLSGELSGVICWWAGGGIELGLFREGTINVVKLGTLDEGSAETPSVRGNFKDHLRF